MWEGVDENNWIRNPRLIKKWFERGGKRIRKHQNNKCFRILPPSNPPFYQFRIPDSIIFVSPRTIFIKSNIYLQAQFSLYCGRKVLKNNSIAFPDLIKVQKIYFILTRFYVTTRYPDLHSAFPGMTNKIIWEYRIFSWVPLLT